MNESPSGGPAEAAFGILFFLVWGLFMLLAFGGMALAIGAIVSAARLPAEAFGPWWDNTKTTWLIGIAVGFLLPCGAVASGVYWFSAGRRSLTRTGVVPGRSGRDRRSRHRPCTTPHRRQRGSRPDLVELP